MTETPPDLTTDKECDSSSEESDDSSVCDNDSEFNDAESSDEKFRSLKFSFMLVYFLNQRGHKVNFSFVLGTKISSKYLSICISF